jgi:hypothetical protein
MNKTTKPDNAQEAPASPVEAAKDLAEAPAATGRIQPPEVYQILKQMFDTGNEMKNPCRDVEVRLDLFPSEYRPQTLIVSPDLYRAYEAVMSNSTLPINPAYLLPPIDLAYFTPPSYSTATSICGKCNATNFTACRCYDVEETPTMMPELVRLDEDQRAPAVITKPVAVNPLDLLNHTVPARLGGCYVCAHPAKLALPHRESKIPFCSDCITFITISRS